MCLPTNKNCLLREGGSIRQRASSQRYLSRRYYLVSRRQLHVLRLRPETAGGWLAISQTNASNPDPVGGVYPVGGVSIPQDASEHNKAARRSPFATNFLFLLQSNVYLFSSADVNRVVTGFSTTERRAALGTSKDLRGSSSISSYFDVQLDGEGGEIG